MKDKGIRAVLGGTVGAAIGTATGGIGPAAFYGLLYAGYGFPFETINKSIDNAKNFICNLLK